MECVSLVTCITLLIVGIIRNSNFERERITLREKFPNTKFFLVRIFPYSIRIRENTDQKKLHIWTLFTQLKWYSCHQQIQKVNCRSDAVERNES